MSASRGVERGVFATYSRRIATAKAEIVYLPLEIRIRIEALVRLVIDAATIPSVMSPDLVMSCSVVSLQTMTASPPKYASIARKNRRGDEGAENNNGAERFHPDFLPGALTARRQPQCSGGAHWGHLENADT